MNKITKALTFLGEVKGELGKIVWPARAELIGSSVVVGILALFFAIILGGMDSSFGTVVKYLIG